MANCHASTAVACPVCTKKISRKSDLPRHMLTHKSKEEKKKLQYACSYPGCQYTAWQLSNLRTHQNTHTQERPHKCPSTGCEFRTNDPGSLTRHRVEIHGYVPKARSGSQSSAVARKGARQRRRASPYTSSSSTSGSSTRSVSPLVPSEPSTPRIDLPNDLSEFPPLSLPVVGSSAGPQNTKNVYAAYSTELITKFPEVNDSPTAPNPQLQNSLLLCSVPGSQTAQYSQLPVPDRAQQEDAYAVGMPTQQASGLPGINQGFGDRLSTFEVMPSNLSNLFAASTLPLLDTSASLPIPAPPLPLTHHATSNAPYGHYGYPTQAASFTSQFSQPYSFAAPCIYSGVFQSRATHSQNCYSQSADWASLYMAPVPTSGFPTQEFCLC